MRRAVTSVSFEGFCLVMYIIYTELTRVEGDFADHDPLGGKAELQFDEAADAVVQLDGNVAGSFEDSILDVGVGDGLSRKVLAADAEEHLGLGEDLQHAQHQTHENLATAPPFPFFIYLKSLL